MKPMKPKKPPAKTWTWLASAVALAGASAMLGLVFGGDPERPQPDWLRHAAPAPRADAAPAGALRAGPVTHGVQVAGRDSGLGLGAR